MSSLSSCKSSRNTTPPFAQLPHAQGCLWGERLREETAVRMNLRDNTKNSILFLFFHVVKFILISVFSLLESPVPGVSDTVKSQLQPLVAKLKKHDSKGVQVVLKRLDN